MGLYSTMRTSASGMAAQANRLGAVSDNIANSSTTGYKRASMEFSSLVLDSGGTEYVSGSVESHTRYAISEQGAFNFTTSVSDLAVKGQGFFLVSSDSGQTFLTRAGSFTPNGTGDLVNAAGYKLMGYSLLGGGPTIVANGTAGLEVVNIGTLALQANPSTAGALNVNLPVNSTVIAPANLPSANAATAQYTAMSSLVAYDNLGNQITLDVYSSNLGGGDWEISVFNSADAAPGGGFPYAGGALATQTLTFDMTNGQLDPSSPTSISVPIPNGATLVLDMSGSSQLAADYTILDATVVNGNAPSEVERIEIADDGTLYAVFESGTRVATYKIPLAGVASPDNMQPLAGNVFVPTADSGEIQIGFPGESGFGTMVSGALEQSTVDLASELTTMIEAERNYTANSKVFQTGSELMEVLVNLKR
ncbi:MAG: flagellar hook protein FlgE [Hyphomicrobium sp.]|uniref:flagellar hook protein FlgE n=1 Tax=Hyphomicrobium sp. TaxID=82 RepID=UPI00132180A1|nr:flagellar hook protein FlgE [Hyphomicrobium sp.]KAB2943267.1 MAG: flagellar hook protein FlgE [Hyphomicrobium sp.]MBZ0210375.1 flagellar hook protein FlgE [Hyphomicrobium sp.]